MDLSGYALTILHQDAEFVLWRGIATASPTPHPISVLVSMPTSERPGPDRIRMLEHELAMRAELDSTWAVRPLALGHHQGHVALILEDQPGEPLERLLDRPTVSRAPGAPRSAEPAMELGLFLRLAAGLAAALGEAHRRGLIHKDVKPGHVLVNTATGQAWLTGFGISSRLPRERQTPDPPEMIAGTLAYMAPEQTGRMNRSIDGRSDLYSLGVTLYQMLTGSLPFTATEPIEWVHCHIARQPIAPGERVANVPAPVSAIIMKLLAKTAEERYQTTAGLERDLRRCLAQWEAERQIGDFPLGEHDTPDRLVIPERLYGRAREVETFLAAFDRVVQGGLPELVLVSGYSGVGKSSVVNELHKVLLPRHALFAAGKFEQYKRDIPYSTLAQAFQSLVRPLLAKSDIELAGWSKALREALGSNGQLMVDLVPELRLIIGEQAPVPELPPQDAQRRFQLLLRRLFAVFARADHPLALFLDDLQWLDAATLDLLEDLLTHPDVPHLLLIGAYRDNEVMAGHPLMGTLDRVRSAGAAVHEIVLAPLTHEHVGHLVADSLYSDQDSAAPLAELVHQKTAGNPFFVIQLLSALVEEGMITFDHGAARWSWDLARIHAKGYTDNVVDLMVDKLTRLPLRTQTVLQRLACLGNSADFAQLILVHECPEEELRDDLQDALQAELLVHADGSYRFLHDRVQEAAYSQIPETQRATAHLRIGRLLLAHTPAEERKEAIFEIANQLNRGVELMVYRDEKEQLAELNLMAGKRAKASTAYVSALNYLVTGTALLSDDGWERRPDLMFGLELHRAECEFLTGELASAETRLTMLSSRAVTPVDRANVTCLHSDVYTALDRSDRAVEVCLGCLRHLSIEWSPHPTQEEVRREYERTWALLGRREIEELIDLPLMSDPEVEATMEVLTKATTAATFTDSNLHSLILWRMVNLSLEFGNTQASCQAYTHIFGSAGPRFGNYEAGRRFGRLGYELVERRGFKRFQARTYYAYAVGVVVEIGPLRAASDLLRHAFEAANTAGDLTYAAFACMHLVAILRLAGEPLVDAQREAERGLKFAQRARFGLAIDILATQLAVIHTLRGLTATFGCLNGEEFDELQMERRLASDPRLAFPEWRYWTQKLQARFFAGDYASAVDASRNVRRLRGILSTLETPEAHFYSALSHAASCDSASPVGYRQHLEAVAEDHRQLQTYAGRGLATVQSRAELVNAEIARVEGRELDAERLYEVAIHSARDNGFVQNEALANELAARFYAGRGLHTIAHAYLRNARYGYLRWGADGKVRQLDQHHPRLRQEERASGPTGTIEAPVEQLDLATVIKVSQAVSGEMVLERLIDRLMRAAIEHAGAERGLLVNPQNDELQIDAEATAHGEEIAVQVRERDACIAVALPESLIRYAIRTRETVILDDASSQNPFTADPYIVQRRARSILCLPLINQGKLIGILYLENSLTPHVFTPDRVTVLKVLASQAAISLENTRLYRDLKANEAELRRAHTHLTEAQRLSQSGSFTWDVLADDHTWSAETYRIFGFEPGSKVTMPVIQTVIHPEDMPAVAAVIGGAVEGADFDLVFRIVTPSGALKHAHVVGHRSQTITDRPVFVGAVQDVTESKIAEEALRVSERNARLIVDSIPGFVAVFTSGGELELVNRQALEYYGKTLEELRHWETSDTIHPQDIPRVVDVFTQSIASGEPFEVELRARRFDGVYHWFQSRGFPLRDANNRIVRWYNLLVDIDERKRAEEALTVREAKIRRLVDANIIGTFFWDADGRVVDANEEFLRIIGYSREDLVAGRLGWTDFTLPEWRELELRMLEELREAGGHRSEEREYLRKDGTRVPVLTGGTMFDGVPDEGLAFVVDLTERKRDEAEIRALKDQLYRENLALRDEVDRASMFEEIIGSSQTLKTVLSRIARVAPTDSTVFISGETGTGKELIARAVHKRSQRSGRAFVSVNCAALAPTLIPSELFGHEKGAFTGATQRRLGRFELADGGTIFLDEVGELLPDTQVALLRVLQEREFERVGGTQPIHVDVRVIAATNRDLKAAIANGSFRQDLFYRLNVFPLQVPPLRDRKDDLLMLVEYFVQRYASRAGKNLRSIDKKTLELLQAYDWPGNIRELQNVIERSVILSSGGVFAVDELWLSTQSSQPTPRVATAAPFEGDSRSEQEIIEAALAESRGRVAGPSGAAARLNIPASTLEYKIRSLKIRKSQFKFGGSARENR